MKKVLLAIIGAFIILYMTGSFVEDKKSSALDPASAQKQFHQQFRGLAIGQTWEEFNSSIGDEFKIEDLNSGKSYNLKKNGTICGSAAFEDGVISVLNLKPCYFNAEFDVHEFASTIRTNYKVPLRMNTDTNIFGTILYVKYRGKTSSNDDVVLGGTIYSSGAVDNSLFGANKIPELIISKSDKTANRVN